jgi:hypothetical protein
MSASASARDGTLARSDACKSAHDDWVSRVPRSGSGAAILSRCFEKRWSFSRSPTDDETVDAAEEVADETAAAVEDANSDKNKARSSSWRLARMSWMLSRTAAQWVAP